MRSLLARTPFPVAIAKVMVATEPVGSSHHSFVHPGYRLLVGLQAVDSTSRDGEPDIYWGSADVTADEAGAAWAELLRMAEDLAETAIDVTHTKLSSRHHAPAAAINQALAHYVFVHAPQLKRKVAVGKLKRAPQVDTSALATAVKDVAYFPVRPDSPLPQQNDYSDELIPGAFLGPSGTAMREKLALSMGFDVLRLSKYVIVVSDPNSNMMMLFDQAFSSNVGLGGTKVALDKALTRRLLNRTKLPVAPGFSVSASSPAKAQAKAEKIGFPLVVKPSKGAKGAGITTGITSWESFHRAIREAGGEEFRGNRVIVERHVEGDDYRFLVTGSGVVSVTRREIGFVVGNGQESVLDLVTAYNAQRKRVPSCQGTAIDINDQLKAKLAEQSHHLHSVPDWNETVYLMSVANVSQGALGSEVFAETHPSLIAAAEEAIRSTGMVLGGVDMIFCDNRVSIWDQQVAITEVNSNPSFTGHYFPNFGTGRSVFENEIRDHIANEGFPQPDIAKELCVRLTIRGDVTSTMYCEWMAEAARQLDVNGWVGAGENSSEVMAVIQGPADHVAVLARRSIEGPKAANPVEVFTEHLQEPVAPGFSLR